MHIFKKINPIYVFRFTAICQIIIILCPWGLRLTYGAYGPQGIKLVKQIGKKNQEATGEKLNE